MKNKYEHNYDIVYAYNTIYNLESFTYKKYCLTVDYDVVSK